MALREIPELELRRFGRVPCFPLFGEYQTVRFETGKIRHNSLSSAFANYSGIHWPSALRLIKGRHRFSLVEMRFCSAFQEFT
jgi:hypothetical protein